MDNRLAEAYMRFDSWCKRNRHTTAIDEFTKASFGMGGQGNNFPTTLGGKAFDTALIMAWLGDEVDHCQVGIASLVASGEVLQENSSLELAGLQDGDSVQAVARPHGMLASNRYSRAFA
ncbi:unnamed protein product [Cladocopium goreaui]|uniref:Uncharacterized protein n=1 Tax=Cladocopium goreaui TaxID=2562237 RepID=A0A9P1BRQ5_9DINO|nr:unnamed protein product [Cladocopium goreaui]